MVDAISEDNKSTFAEDFLKQLSIIRKILIKPIPSTFRSILDYPASRITATIALLVIARLGANTIELSKGNEFFTVWTIASLLYLPLLAYSTNSMCKDFFRVPKHLFKQLFLAFVAIYFASTIIHGILTGLALLVGRFQDVAQWLVLVYQAGLAVMAVHALANLNLWKSTFAIVVAHLVATLGFIFIGPIIEMLLSVLLKSF